jgi:2,4-dienoyl-CoA reductase-like NADH-dependent reductase (Old Yellow Enzyme family)/thioredoxin reductase
MLRDSYRDGSKHLISCKNNDRNVEKVTDMSNSNKVQFEKLFEPGFIGKIKIDNRVVMAPMYTGFAHEDRSVSERLKSYYEARAKGGVGLIIVEATCVEHHLGSKGDCQLLIDDDKFIPGLSELAHVIHKHGAKAAIQIHHAGRMGEPAKPRTQPVAPSPIADPRGQLPRELTIEEIQGIINCYAQAAERAAKAGFDGVELHGAHEYLINQFLSAASNKRQDKYGGDLKNRARFLVEIIRACKEATGKDYPVWARINGRESAIEDGITLEESRQTAKLSQEAGADAVHVTGFTQGFPEYAKGWASYVLPHIGIPMAFLSYLAENIKKNVSVPVIAVGRILPEFGERLLRDNKADFIALGKSLLADPDWANKLASGQPEDIRHCMYCCTCMRSIAVDIRSNDKSLLCAINATVGKEEEAAISPAERARKVLVIGGGPAGLEAARVAALRGHDVTLWEKEGELGGQLTAAARPPYKKNIQNLKTYLVHQVEKLGVKVELNKEADLGQVERLNPDVVVLAAGIKPKVPEIRGIERASVVLAQDVLTEKVPVGETAIVIGGALVGCETAEFLAEKMNQVTITRRGPEMASEVEPKTRGLLLDRLKIKGLTMLTEVKYEEITDEGLLITTKEGKKRLIKADTIVLATGARPNSELFQVLKDKGYETHLIGDSVKPRTILDAVYDGFEVGLAI